MKDSTLTLLIAAGALFVAWYYGSKQLAAATAGAPTTVLPSTTTVPQYSIGILPGQNPQTPASWFQPDPVALPGVVIDTSTGLPAVLPSFQTVPFDSTLAIQ